MGRSKCFRLLVAGDEGFFQDLSGDDYIDNGQKGNLKRSPEIKADFLNDSISASESKFSYNLTYCKQAGAAVKAVELSVREGDPFSCVFIDMPLLQQGNEFETAKKIRDIDPEINIVAVTNSDDVDSAELKAQVPPASRILQITKPIKPQIAIQFADFLTENWIGSRKSKETLVRLRSMAHRKEKKLRKTMVLLAQKRRELEEYKVALKVVSNHQYQHEVSDKKHKEINNKVMFNVFEITEPYIEKLENSGLKKEQENYLSILKNNLHKLTNSGMLDLAKGELQFTSTELRVANLIMQRKTSKEIACIFNVSPRTVEYHRNNIRKKFGLSGARNISLLNYLRTLDI